jgi:hypothetical protein
MSNTTERLELCAEILSLIERRRIETGDESLGTSIERVVLDTQFQELEQEIMDSPGAIEPWLVRRRRKGEC